MAANQFVIELDDPSDLQIVEGAPATLIECHAEAAAELVMHSSDSVFAFEMAEVMQGPVGNMPAHAWNGTALAFERPDGSFDAPVDLKGEPGEGLDNYTGDPLTFFILAAN